MYNILVNFYSLFYCFRNTIIHILMSNKLKSKINLVRRRNIKVKVKIILLGSNIGMTFSRKKLSFLISNF